MTYPPHPTFAALRQIDWDDTSSILHGCTELLDALDGDRSLLADLVAQVGQDPHLADMCEGYDFMRKIVLHDARDLNIRLRLHLYQAGFFDRPHNHRWSFASRILHGSYTHRVFGSDDQFVEDTDPHTLRPVYKRVEGPGSTYALHHTSVHTVQAEADTISLLVRGPSAKHRFLIIDAAVGGFFWVYGAAQESSGQRANKRLSPEHLKATLTRVQHLLTSGGAARRTVPSDGREPRL